MAGPERHGRECPDCGGVIAGSSRHCSSCGRFVPGGPSTAAGFAAKTGLLLVPPLVLLAIMGYVWIPVLGLAAEIALWVVVLSQR